MPYVLLILFAFALGLFWDKSASRQTYVVLALGAVAATLYFMR
jgi:hypothetical protein